VNLQTALQRRIFETHEFKWVTKKGGISCWKAPTKTVYVNAADAGTVEGDVDNDDDEDNDNDDGKCEKVVQMVKALNLGVEYSMTRPEPDTSWMEKFDMVPWKRSKFTGWLTQ